MSEEIKMTDLIAGETVLITKTGGECIVLEALSRTVLVSGFNANDIVSGWYTTKELAGYGFTIKPKESLADRFPKDTPVALSDGSVRYSAGRVDDDGYLICYTNGRTSLTSNGHLGSARNPRAIR